MTVSVPLALGAFDLESIAGRGGMAEVWAATHRASGVPVAIKVMRGERATNPRYQSFFRNEVRAVAALEHPCIVHVLDHGEIPEATAALSAGRITHGSPFLVMEWVSGPTLAERLPLASWSEIRHVLVRLLDALAHAHARGLVHRDIKPANVLQSSGGDSRPGWKLTDFGIANPMGLASDPMGGKEIAAGTPPYMAPEQIRAEWRDQGPWTDLYSLGCVAFALATGHPPFQADTKEGVVGAHLLTAMPPLDAAVPVPDGLEAWIRTMLEKDPARRFRRAADAAWALARLGNAASRTVSTPPRPVDTEEQTMVEALRLPTLAALDPPSSLTLELDVDAAEIAERGASATEQGSTLFSLARVTPAVPPMPEHWTQVEAPRTDAALAGVGLGLWGLRPIPLVDRLAERDALWAELRAVYRDRTLRVVLLHGLAGCGKSRLAEWLCERAHEVGTATIMTASHAPIAGEVDGLAGMLARHFRIADLPRSAAVARVSEWARVRGGAEREEGAALAQAAMPRVGVESLSEITAVRFRNAAERHAAVLRAIELECTERPVILRLEDVHWGLDALELVRGLLASPTTLTLPILVVMTLRDESLRKRSKESAVVAQLASTGSLARIAVGPLGAEDHATLVGEMLGLEPALAVRVEERTAGNALFAVQLVGDWIERGWIEPGPRGFRLTEGARPVLPADLLQVWEARLSRLLDLQPPQHAWAFELAAVLGSAVDTAEWTSACRRQGIRAPMEVLEEMLRERLARADENGPERAWSFAHGMLREALEQRAIESGRWQQHHRTCAELLRARGGDAAAERMGRHLLEAGDSEAAIEPLLDGARSRMDAGEYRLCEALLDEADRAATACELSGDDRRRAANLILRAWCAWREGRLADATAHVADLRDSPVPAISAEASLLAGAAAFYAGDRTEGLARMETALLRAVESGDRRIIREARMGIADVLWRTGDHQGAREAYQLALEGCRAMQDTLAEARALLGLALTERGDGRLVAAAGLLEQTRELFAQAGSRWGVATAINALADVERERGDLVRAEALYRDGIARVSGLGTGDSVYAEMSLVVLLLQDGARMAEARSALESIRRRLPRGGAEIMLGPVFIGLAACDATAGDWSEFDDNLDRGRRLLAETGMVDPDNAALYLAAGDRASAASELERACVAYDLAARQLDALGRSAQRDAVRRKIASLRGPSRRS